MTAATGRNAGRPSKLKEEETQDFSDEGVPPYPTGLTATSKKVWDQLWTVGKWLHREQHVFLVTLYCNKIDDIIQWEKELKSLSNSQKNDKKDISLSTYQQANGSWAPFPQVRLIQEARAQLTAWLIELRLTPSSSPENVDESELISVLMTKNRSI